MSRGLLKDLIIKMSLDEDLIEKYDQYKEILKNYNSHTNLTSITSDDEIYLKHFIDSLLVLEKVSIPLSSRMLDFGTGAGFPGMVIAIARPDIEMVLIDSVGKKTKFLELLKEEMDINNVKIVTTRVENYSAAESFDFITARAVADIAVLCELSTRLLKVGGKLLFLRGGVEKLLVSESMLKKLRLKTYPEIIYKLPIVDAGRKLIIFEKTAPTPKLYPRNFGQIKKNPL